MARIRFRAAAVALAAALAPALNACRDVTSLTQDAPSRVRADQLYIPGNAQLLLNSAVGDYECALTNYIVAAGLVGDELGDAQLLAVGWDYDRRTISAPPTCYAYPDDEIVRRVGALPLAYPFRSGFEYQNIMYAVAGDVVAAASGVPRDTFLRTRIWTPLGMTETEPTLAAITGGANVAAPHAEVGDTVRVITSRP